MRWSKKFGSSSSRPLTWQYLWTCSAMLPMCTMYWCSLCWYWRAATRASLCRAVTRARSHRSLLFHPSLAIRTWRSRDARLPSSASAAERSASTQRCSASPDSGRPHPRRQTPDPGFVSCIGTFSGRGAAVSARIVRAGERGDGLAPGSECASVRGLSFTSMTGVCARVCVCVWSGTSNQLTLTVCQLRTRVPVTSAASASCAHPLLGLFGPS